LHLDQTGSCSSIIKLTDDFSEIFGGHSTWTSYGSMTRVFKYYNFPLNNPALKSTL